MSRYFDALNRLRRGRNSARIPDLRLAEQPAPIGGSAPEEVVAGPGLAFPELQLAARQTSYAALLDLLRATSKTASIPAVVIAGVSGGEPIREVVTGIELQAQRQGISLKRGHLAFETGARILHLSSRKPLGETPAPDNRESLRLSGALGPEVLAEWLEQAAADSDLLLIEAPPISSSVEAALLGGACGGLVLVAEVLITKRGALEESIERIGLAGCEILGLVLTGTRRWLPNWLARLIDLLRRP